MVSISSKNSQGESLNSLKARVQNNPQDGSAWLALAQRLAQSEPGSELRQAIEKSIELLPDEYQAWFLAGLELQHRQGPTAARNWLLRIADQRSKLVAPRLAHASLLLVDDAEKARQAFESIIEEFPRESRAHLLLAELLQNQGKTSAAGDHLEAALNLKPDVAENWAALAMLRLAENQLDGSVMAATRALELNDSAVSPRLTRAEVYRQAARWDEAIEDFQVARKLLPQNPVIFLGLGACLAAKGEYASALQHFEQALLIKPDLAEARLNIALVKSSQGQLDEALSRLEKFLQEPGLQAALSQVAITAHALVLKQIQAQELLSSTVAKEVSLATFRQITEKTSESLSQPDTEIVERLQRMANACQQPEFGILPTCEKQNVDSLTFLEACLLDRVAIDPRAMAEIRVEISSAGENHSALSPNARKVMHATQLIRDRQGHSAVFAGGDDGEAWVRYWHYRLFAQTAQYHPGMFKVAPNSIGLHRTVAPQHLTGTYRVLMNEVYPSISPGTGRAVFMLSAINLIHGFIDGNGRLARFFFACELEQSGQSPVFMMPDARKELVSCLVQAQYKFDFEPYCEFLTRLATNSRNLNRQFQDCMSEMGH